ncbi:prepilin peptidase [Candidatus Woesearchaeota archaeon]|nr:prepilin peptidase [Candidatus Woesearchaeota archaeon]
MLIDIVLIIVLIALIIGSFVDIKTREVPDWLNFGLIFAGFGIRLIASFATFDWSYIIDGLFGFLLFFILAYLMFYTGQWGGGDSKMLMGLGALLGLRFELHHFTISFLINIFLIGAFYGLVWATSLAFKHRKDFLAEIKRFISQPKIVRLRKILIIGAIVLLFAIMIIQDTLIRFGLFFLLFMVYGFFYVWLFARTVEKVCMYKHLEPKKLTEGDWIAEDIVVRGKRICGPKDLGIEKKQIKQLIELYKKKKIKKVLVKEGIPFVPSFLIAFIVTYFVGNLVMLFI